MGSAIAAVVAVPGAAVLLDPLLRRASSKTPWRDVGPEAALSSKVPKAFAVLGERVDAWTRAPEQRLGTVWLRQQRGGDGVQALTAECPHLGCQIAFDAKEHQYVCPCHRSGFDLEGEVLYGPSPRPLDSLEARVNNGRVQVRFARFQPQVKEKKVIG